MKYIQYSVELLEPMKLAGQGTQQGTVITRSFIQGSAIRGALIGAFLRKNPGLSIDDSIPLREEFLTKTKFYNAYIMQGKLSTLPVPFIYATTKEESRKQRDIKIENRITRKQQDTGEVVFGKNQFGNMKDDRLVWVPVKKRENLHIQKAEEKGIENKMFRYQAIERGQVFQGYIQCEDRWVEDFRKLMEKPEFFIGGSKGTGYGRCKIRFEAELSYERFLDELPIQRDDNSDFIILYAMSDLLLLDEYGMVTNHVDCKYLARELGIENLLFVQSFCDTSMTFGYNQKWKANAVQQTAVQAGSVLVYQIKGSQKIEPENMKRLEQKGVGLRKEEGFGQIYINPKWNQKTAISVQDKEDIQPNDQNERDREHGNQLSSQQIFSGMNLGDRVFVVKTVSKIRDKRNRERIQFTKIPAKYKEIGREGFRLSKTQAKSIENLLRDIYGKREVYSEIEARKQISLYLTKQKNLTALEATMLYVDEKHPVSLKDFIEHMANGNEDLAQIEKDWKTETLTAEERFYECCFYLMELLAYYAQKEDK